MWTGAPQMATHFARTVTLAVMLAGSAPLLAQISLRPTPPPTVTAENAAWYQADEPISFNGNLYYPSGPVVHFNRNEMVRSGYYDAVPLYTRTTHEPRSIVYVPLPGGLVKPYERRRSGELAGTSGSTTPSFPVTLPAEEDDLYIPPRAPSPPTGEPVSMMGASPRAGESDAAATDASQPVAVGPGGLPPAPPAPSAPGRLETARRPEGVNNVFLQFENARWMSAGPAVAFAADKFTRAGDYHGFAVYTRQSDPDRIFVSTVPGSPVLLTPYERKER